MDLGTIASTALGFAAAMGQDMGIQVPQNMPPIGYSLSLSDNGAASRVFVPLPIITFTKDITLMFAPMFGGMGDEGGNYDDEGGSAPAPPRY